MARLNRRYRKRFRRNPDEGGGGSSSGPPFLGEIGEFVLPGFAGFAATRFATRTAQTQIATRWPDSSWGKHAGAVASLGSFLAAWLLAHKWKWLAKYQTPLVVGSAIAALQSLIQLYVPRLGWMIADASPELDTTVQQLQAGGTQAALSAQLPPGMTPVNDDPNLYVYNDAYDAGRYSQPASGNQSQQAASPSPTSSVDDDMEDLAINSGIFAQ